MQDKDKSVNIGCINETIDYLLGTNSAGLLLPTLNLQQIMLQVILELLLGSWSGVWS